MVEMLRSQKKETPLVTLKQLEQVETLPAERWTKNARGLKSKESVDSLQSVKKADAESLLISPVSSSLRP